MSLVRYRAVMFVSPQWSPVSPWYSTRSEALEYLDRARRRNFPRNIVGAYLLAATLKEPTHAAPAP
jgi:hypothetical protein